MDEAWRTRPECDISLISADLNLQSHEPGTRIGSGRVNKMYYHVAGEIMPLRPNVAGSVTGAVPTVRGKLKQPRIAIFCMACAMCSVHEAKCSDTSDISE